MIPNDIDTQVPVVSQHGARIEAPIEVLWRLHTDVDARPTWQRDVETAHIERFFAPGSIFSWRTGGLDVESTICRVEPGTYTLGEGGIHSE